MEKSSSVNVVNKRFLILLGLVVILTQHGSGAPLQSKSFQLFGRVSGQNQGILSGGGFSLAEGFLRSVYFFIRRIVIPPPQVISVLKSKGYNNEKVQITLSGENFRAGANVKLSKAGENDIVAENVVVEAGNKIICTFDLSGRAIGLWDLIVTNDDEQVTTLAQGFKIESPLLSATQPVRSDLNPFNPRVGSTKLKYSLSQDTDITIYVFNMRGERVWQWSAPAGSPGASVGENEVVWSGITAFKSFIGTGVYFVHVTTRVDGQIKTLSRTKIAVIK